MTRSVTFVPSRASSYLAVHNVHLCHLPPSPQLGATLFCKIMGKLVEGRGGSEGVGLKHRMSCWLRLLSEAVVEKRVSDMWLPLHDMVLTQKSLVWRFQERS